MNVKQLFADEDAVSPVIGVILMVAITVILAAVIGTFVLGLGENVQDSAPQANFQFEYNDGPNSGWAETGSTENEYVNITHTGGEDVDVDTVSVLIGGTTAWDGGSIQTDFADGPTTWSGTISTGSEQQIEDSANNVITAGDEVRVVWTSPSGGNSNTIGSSSVPS